MQCDCGCSEVSCEKITRNEKCRKWVDSSLDRSQYRIVAYDAYKEYKCSACKRVWQVFDYHWESDSKHDFGGFYE